MREFKGFRRGINFGGWLSQCGNAFRKEHHDTFITEEDAARVASWGIDHIRLPIDYYLVETREGEEITEGYTYIDNCIEWCKKYGLNMILDVHKTAGFAFDEIETAGDLFNSEELQKRFINLWIKLAKRYAKYEDFVVFELLNEVVLYDVAEQWNALIRKTVTAIRTIAPTVKIIVGGVCYNSVGTVSLLDKPYDENIVFTFHCYEPLLFTHQKAYWIAEMPPSHTADYPDKISVYQEGLKFLAKEHCTVIGKAELDGAKQVSPDFFEILFSDAVKFAEDYDVPLYCGEYGVIDKAPVEGTLNWYRDINATFEKYNIGRSAWTYKAMDFGLTEERYNSVRDELVKML